MANFKTAFDITLRNEGGIVYTNNPDDNGGETFAGVSRNNNPTWAGWQIIDRLINAGKLNSTLKDHNSEDYKSLYDAVYFLYKNKYWDATKGDLITNQTVANKFYDACVNPGFISLKFMQESICDIAQEIICDGVIGYITINAINDVNPIKLLNRFIVYLEAYYKSQHNAKYEAGWLARARRIE